MGLFPKFSGLFPKFKEIFPSRFVYRIKNNLKSGMSKNEAIEEAVDFAIAENYLEGFFKTQRAEVIGMILTEFNEEQAHKAWRED